MSYLSTLTPRRKHRIHHAHTMTLLHLESTVRDQLSSLIPLSHHLEPRR